MLEKPYQASLLHVANSTGCLRLVSGEGHHHQNISHQKSGWKCSFAIWLLQETFNALLKVFKTPFNEGLCIVRVQNWLKESKGTPTCSLQNCSQSILMSQYWWKTFQENFKPNNLRTIDGVRPFSKNVFGPIRGSFNVPSTNCILWGIVKTSYLKIDGILKGTMDLQVKKKNLNFELSQPEINFWCPSIQIPHGVYSSLFVSTVDLEIGNN